jgi:hypothetical protein
MAESESITPYLEENGPTPRSEVPIRPDIYHREQGVRLFYLSAGIGDTRSGGGSSVKIAYLREHEQADVCRRFFESNPEFVEAQTYKSASRLSFFKARIPPFRAGVKPTTPTRSSVGCRPNTPRLQTFIRIGCV